MRRKTISRLLFLIPTVVLISLLAFALLYYAPGDAARSLLEQRVRVGTLTEENVAQFAQNAGLDKGFWELYAGWAGGILRGNFGASYVDGQSVGVKLGAATAKTLVMSLVALGAYICFGTLMGVLAAASRRGVFERVARYWAVFSTAIPVFWISLFVVWLLSVKLGVLATVGSRGYGSLVLPGMLMGLVYAGNLIVIAQEKTCVILEEPYVLCARALGVRRGVILRGHVLPGLAAPVLATSALSFSSFLGAGVLMENIFSLQGLGTLLTNAINVKDYWVVAGATLVIGVLVCVANLLADLLQDTVDKREVCHDS